SCHRGQNSPYFHSLTHVDDAARRKRGLLVVNIYYINHNPGGSCHLRRTLVSSNHSQLIIISDFPIQHYICFEYSTKRRLYLECVIVISINYVVKDSGVGTFVVVESHHLKDESPLFVAFPYRRRILLLSEFRSIIIDVM